MIGVSDKMLAMSGEECAIKDLWCCMGAGCELWGAGCELWGVWVGAVGCLGVSCGVSGCELWGVWV